MSKSKDKRIKKLKRKRIWPSILGLFVITTLFTMFMAMILMTSVTEVVRNKFVSSFEISNQLVRRNVDANVNDLEQAYNGILTDVNMMDGIDAVSIMSSEEKIWSSCGVYPEGVRLSYGQLFMPDMSYADYDMIVEEDEQNVIIKSGDTYEINENIFQMLDYKYVLSQLGEDNIKEWEPLVSMKIWLVFPAENLEVFVLNDIHVYLYDVMLLISIALLFAILLIVFIIYYISTLIGVIANQSRVTKVLYTDMVTGGDNWLAFVRKGSRLIKRNYGNRNRYAVIHLRMEKYRSFCTCFGVREGEELLERFYKILKKQIKRKEAMAHYEQADFALLLRYEDEENLKLRIEKIEQALNNITPNIKLYFSAGICFVEKRNQDIEELYNNAMSATGVLDDDVEYRVAFFDIEMKKQQLWERKVEDEMERALKNREFKVYLQPKYSAKEEKMAGAEALVRWIHPVEGFIPPNKFIPIFERNGFILQLDDYMLEEVAKQQAQWIQSGQNVVPVSVNISRAHFTREDLAEHICEIVDKFNIPHNVIELELTESAFFDDKQVLLGTVKKLREHGFVVSMDDFGAGYSSLNSLKELHIDVLKIDADFFRGVDSAERGMLIVSEVIDLAKKLDMKIVAEGIESREQVDFLAEQECDLIQGYYFAKPMPIEEFEEKYKEE